MYPTVMACFLALGAAPEWGVKPIEMQILVAEVTESGERLLAERLAGEWSGTAGLKETLIDPDQFGPAVVALKKSGALERLSAPTVRTLSGHEGVVQVGQEVAFVTGCEVRSVGPDEGQKVLIPWNESFQTGVTLTVKPRLNFEGGHVDLRLQVELATLTDPEPKLLPMTTLVFPEIGSAGQPIPLTEILRQPTISTVGFEAARQIPLGKSLVMVGWEHPTYYVQDLRVPMVGRLLKHQEPITLRWTVTERRKLMVVVTPKVVE